MQLSGDPERAERRSARGLERLPGAPPRPLKPGSLDGSPVIVDAVLGTGCTARHAARRSTRSRRSRPRRALPVIACDVPSGVDASTGEVAGPAVRAVATATFHAAKPGLWIAPGKQHAGRGRGRRDRHPATAHRGRRRHRADRRRRARRAAARAAAEATKFTAATCSSCGGSPGSRARRRWRRGGDARGRGICDRVACRRRSTSSSSCADRR